MEMVKIAGLTFQFHFCVSNYTPIYKDRFDTYCDNLGIDLMDNIII